MAKIRYNKCDICDEMLNTDPRFFGYRNGVKFVGLFQSLDICTNCMKKIKYLVNDIKIEQKCIDDIFNKKIDNYNYDIDEKSSYLQGVTDTLEILSHKRLKRV